MLSENNREARVAQSSPWYNPPAYDPVAEVIKRIQRDADRLDAVTEDDRRWFEAHPERDFHVRVAAPTERDVGTAYDLVLVSQVAPGVRWRCPIACGAPRAELASVAEYFDTADRAAGLFDAVSPNFHPANTCRGLYRMI